MIKFGWLRCDMNCKLHGQHAPYNAWWLVFDKSAGLSYIGSIYINVVSFETFSHLFYNNPVLPIDCIIVGHIWTNVIKGMILMYIYFIYDKKGCMFVYYIEGNNFVIEWFKDQP